MLAQLLKDAQAGKFQVVLCWKMNRFARGVKDFIHNIEILHNAGIRFICTSQPIVDTDPRNPSGKMLMALLMVLADFERDLMGEHIQWSVARALKAQGLARYGCPQHSRSGKNLHGAIADFTKAIEAKPDHAEAYRSRGLAIQRQPSNITTNIVLCKTGYTDAQPKPRAALIMIWRSTTLTTPSPFKSSTAGIRPKASLIIN